MDFKKLLFCSFFLLLFISFNARAQTAADTALATKFGDSAEIRMHNNDFNSAVYFYTQQIKTPLKMGIFYYNRANAESFLSQYENAAKDYDTAIKMDTTLILAYMNQAYMYMQLHKTDEAFADYAKGLKAANDSQNKANMFISRGNAYLTIGKLPEAESDFNNGIKYNPYSWQGWFQLGTVSRKLKKLKPALEALNRADKLKPNYQDIILVRGITKYELDQYKPAIKDLTTALKMQENTDGFYFRGLARLKADQDSLAREDFNKILAKDKKNIIILNSRAEANFKMKHPKLAIKDYNTIISLMPKSGEAYANRAYVYTQMGDKTKACEDWHKAKALGVVKAQEAIKKFCRK